MIDFLLVFTILLNFTAAIINPHEVWWHLAIIAALVTALLWRVR